MMRNGGAGNNGVGGFRRNGMGTNGMRPIAGQIIGKDSNSITVKMQDGSSKIIILSAQTKVMQTQTASVSELQTGQTVAVFGTTNSDGSVTAQNVMLNPQNGRGMMGGQSGTPSVSGSPSPSAMPTK